MRVRAPATTTSSNATKVTLNTRVKPEKWLTQSYTVVLHIGLRFCEKFGDLEEFLTLDSRVTAGCCVESEGANVPCHARHIGSREHRKPKRNNGGM